MSEERARRFCRTPASGSTLGRAAIAAVALTVVLSLWAAPAAAASGSVEIEAAVADDTDATTMEFTFVASQNGTVTLGADDSVRRDGGDVVFEFDRWSGGGDSGSGSTWDVVAGEEYTVRYDATASSGASETRHSASVDVRYQDGSYETDETLYLDVDVLEPDFGYVGTVSGEVVFDGPDTGTTTVEADVPNVGDGVMIVEDVSYSSVPSGISASAESVPSRIDAGSSEAIETRVEVDDRVSEGTYTFDATVTDSLGNEETYSVSVEVVKPPVADVSGGEIEVGDVVVGESKTVSFRVDEVGGYEELSGLDVDVTSGDADGSASFNVPYSFSTSAGGSDTAEVTVAADATAQQHSDLGFEATMSGTDTDSPDQSVSVTGRVIYPASLGTVDSSPDTLVYDEPRSQVSTHRQETTVDIPNEGDLEMNVADVTAQVNDPDVTATVVDAPSTVEGLETGTATVAIEGDTDAAEGAYDLTVRVRTDDAGEETITREFEVVHDTDLSVAETDVEFGEVTITDQVSRSLDVSERLGYEDLDGVEVTVVEGPDRWMSISSRPPSQVSAGDSAPLVFDLKFDTEAQAYQEYVWTVRVDADNADTETITVSATAQLLSVEDVTTDLNDRAADGGWQREAAESTVDGLNSMEQHLRDGEEVASGDIWRTLTVGQSTVVLIDAVETVEQRQAEGDYEAAQPRVVSALVARNLVSEYVSDLEDESTAREFRPVVEATVEPVATIVEEQEDHYKSILDDDGATALERYRASESLATLSEHQGDEERASEYDRLAEEQFAEYQRLVAEGTERRQRARDRRQQFDKGATLTVLSQPVVLNPARIDEVRRTRAAVEEDYATAEQRFGDAGASAEADATASEADAAASELTVAEYVLYGATAVFAIAFVAVVARELLNARTYVRESREAAAGDFLL